jgi:uncharacterized membrane protein YfcA
MPAFELAISLLVIAAGYCVLGMTGFGSALTIVPVLAQWLPLSQVVPTVLSLDILACFLLGAASFREVAWRELGVLVPGVALGAAAGIILADRVPGAILLGLLALLIIAFAIRGLVLARLPVLATRKLGGPAGLAAGIIESLFGVAGPVVVMYLGGRIRDPQRLRPTIVVALLGTSIGALVAIAFDAGLPSGDLLKLMAGGAAIIPLSLYAGTRVSRRLGPARMIRVIHLLLLASGGALLLRALAG